MYDQPTDPGKEVYAIYKVLPNQDLYPEPWYDNEQDANNRKKSKEDLSDELHKVIKTTYELFLADLRSS